MQLAVKAQAALKEEGKDVSVVSIPSWDRFDKQDAAYKESVLPKAVKKRVGIEMASSWLGALCRYRRCYHCD